MKTAALIGISNYARNHLMVALEQALHGRLRLAAATVVNAADEQFLCERLRRLGCEIFTRTDEMWAKCAGKIDLCFIPTGIHLHGRMTIEALCAGANVVVEKPLATSLEDAWLIRQLERDTGRFVAVGFQDLYTASTWTIKKLLLGGELGRLERISFRGLWPRPVGYYTRNEWAGKLQMGELPVFDSPVNNAFAHFLNLALFWSGTRLEASARAENLSCELYRAQPIESFDTCCVRAQLTGGARLHFCATHSCSEDRVPLIVLETTRGKIEWKQESHYEITLTDGTRRRIAIPRKLETKLTMADAVLQRLDDSTAPICTTEIALAHMQFVHAMHQAAPIMAVSPEYIQCRTDALGEWRRIADIEAAVDQASVHRLLWSEMNLPWAQHSTLRSSTGT